MAIPSGSGTEVLKETFATSNNSVSYLLTVPTNHIYTIISIIVCNNTANDVTANKIIIDPDGGTYGEMVIFEQAINSKETFVVNEKIVLSSGDKLYVTNASANTLNVLVSYIDQDWS